MPTSRNFDLSQSVTSRDENVDDRVAALLVGGANITVTYDDAAGTLTVDGQSGYTDTDVGNYLSTNGYATQTAIVAAITDSAPTTLDTLNELAAALGDDPNFATTVTNQIGTKLATADFNTTADTWLGTKSTTDVAEGTNLYFLYDRVRGATINAGSLRGTVNDATVQYGTAYSGTPVQGSFFFDSLNQKLKVYTGSAFVDAVPAGSGGGGGGSATGANATFSKYTYSITTSTNAVSGADDASETLSYVTTGEQNVEVYVNGVKQVEGAANDYVATTGTSVTFVDNLSSGDVVDIQVYELLTNDAYYLKTETYTQTETNSQISTALSGAISPSSATINDLEINRIISPTDYTYIKKTSTGSNFAITSPESIYLNIDSNNDQTNRALFIVANTDQPGSGTVIAKFQEDGNVGIGTESPNTATNYRSLHIDGSVGSLIDIGASGLESRIVADTNGLGFQVTPGSHTYQNIRWKAGQIGGATDSHMLLNSSGNVGIGTDSPDSKLHVSSTRPHMDFEDTAASTKAKFGAGYANAYIATTSSGGDIFFKNAVGDNDFPHSSGTNLAIIGANGYLKTYGNTFHIHAGQGSLGHANEFQFLTTEVTPSVSGSWYDVCYVSHSPNLKFHGMSVQSNNASFGGARFHGALLGTYGSVALYQEHKRVTAMNGGDVTDINYRYLNSGAPSGSYRLQVQLSFTGGSHTVYTCVYGNATAELQKDGT